MVLLRRQQLLLAARQFSRCYSTKPTENESKIRTLLKSLFNPATPHAADSLTRLRRREEPLTEKKPTSIFYTQETQSITTPEDLLKKHPYATNTLYWHNMGLTFNKSDFERILPPPQIRKETYPPQFDNLSFQVVRSRNPENLTAWIGYYLVFNDPQSACIYFQETQGAELCGLQVKFEFQRPETAHGLQYYLNGVVGGVGGTHIESRDRCALIMGLPHHYTETKVLRALWDYDFVDDDAKAVVELPKGKLRYGDKLFLVQFSSADEPHRLMREFNFRPFPHCDNNQPVLIECI